MQRFDEFDRIVYKEILDRKEQGSSYTNTHSKITNVTLSETEARKQLKGIENLLEAKLDWLEENESEETPKYKESTELCSDGSYKSDKLLKMNAEQSKDVKYLLEAHGFDSGFWQVVSARNNIWNVYSKQDGVQQLYSSKITVKPIIKEFDIDWFKDQFSKINPLKPLKRSRLNNSGKIVELQYADIHIGLRGLSYEEELNQMSDSIISKFKDVEKFVIPLGQDFLNSDHSNGASSTTTKGTVVEQKLDYSEMFKSGIRVISHLTDRILTETDAEIEFIYVPGNHDSNSCFGLFQSIMQRYRLHDNISFDDEIEERKYRLYGVNGIGFGHGQGEGKRIFGLFSVEAPEIFAKAKHREFHLSHLHNESVRDENGVIFRRMPTVNSADKWHKSKGYMGATKRIQAFVYDKNIGLEDIKYFYI